MDYVKCGWPQDDILCREYGHVKNELSIHDEVLVYKNRIVIPSSIRPNILKILHSSHNGIVAMKAEARQAIWWPNMSIDIEETARSCNLCSANNAQVTQENLKWPETGKTWERIHIDYCGPIEN